MNPLYTHKLKKVYTSYCKSIQYDIIIYTLISYKVYKKEYIMKYSNEFKEMVCEEYLHTDIGRKETCEKYNLPLNTIKCWLFRYYHNENKDDKIDIKNRIPVKNNNETYISKKHLNYKNVKDMSKDEMIAELIKKDFEISRLKKSIHG